MSARRYRGPLRYCRASSSRAAPTARPTRWPARPGREAGGGAGRPPGPALRGGGRGRRAAAGVGDHGPSDGLRGPRPRRAPATTRAGAGAWRAIGTLLSRTRRRRCQRGAPPPSLIHGRHGPRPVSGQAETVRIGVVADSHVGEVLPEPPARVLELLAGVDVILHAGDLTDLAVVEAAGAHRPGPRGAGRSRPRGRHRAAALAGADRARTAHRADPRPPRPRRGDPGRTGLPGAAPHGAPRLPSGDAPAASAGWTAWSTATCTSRTARGAGACCSSARRGARCPRPTRATTGTACAPAPTCASATASGNQ